MAIISLQIRLWTANTFCSVCISYHFFFRNAFQNSFKENFSNFFSSWCFQFLDNNIKTWEGIKILKKKKKIKIFLKVQCQANNFHILYPNSFSFQKKLLYIFYILIFNLIICELQIIKFSIKKVKEFSLSLKRPEHDCLESITCFCL